MGLRDTLRRLLRQGDRAGGEESQPPPDAGPPHRPVQSPGTAQTQGVSSGAQSTSPKASAGARPPSKSPTRPPVAKPSVSRATRVPRGPSKQEPTKTPTVSPETPGVSTSVPPSLSLSQLEALLRRPRRVDSSRSVRSEEPESVANEGYRLLDALRDKVGGMLLLTATPMQLHDYELYSMIELVEPGLFNGYGDFAAARSEIAAVNQSVTTLRSDRPNRKAVDECLEVLRAHDAPVELLEAAAGNKQEREIVATWLSRCHRLSEALVRNRKAEIGGFKPRAAHRIDVTPTSEEVELDELVQQYIRAQYAAAPRAKQTAVGLVLVSFQKMLCSSTRALAGALESRANRLIGETDKEDSPLVDDVDLVDEQRQLRELAAHDAIAEAALLMEMARVARDITDAKLSALEGLVNRILEHDLDEKILIFSQFLGSIEMIRTRLAERYSVRVFHGQMSLEDKDKAHEAFRRGTQILISSEAGGEGRNFQFCHIVVNYDLPWNPMKIEQRIGRVDRVGQERDVEIYNFAVAGMLDERILDVLEHRIQIFTETVGALDPILESFEDEIKHIALKGNHAEAFRKLDAELEEQIHDAQQLEELRRDFVLDWRSLQRDEAARLLGRQPRATREDLELFCRTSIGRFGSLGEVKPHADGGLFIRVPGKLREDKRKVEEDYRGSFNVHDALRDERMHFFAMGHPLVESILDNVGDLWWLPATVLESQEWSRDEPALLVDYRLELDGIRSSGCLLSYLVTDEGAREPIEVLQPTDPHLEARLPAWPADRVQRFEKLSLEAARRDAIDRFATFKEDHAAVVERELERLARMHDSRSGFIDDRIARNDREIERLEEFGTESQRRIIPARQGQIEADRKRLAELAHEHRQRVDAIQATIPSFHLRLLGVAMIVPAGRLQELAA